MQPTLPNPRVLAGIALMLVATGLGALTMQRATARVQMWQVSHDLAAGTTLAAGDVHLAEVAVDDHGAYVAVAQRPVGRVLIRDLAAGELLPRTAIGGASPAVALVTLPIDPLHLPAELRRGQRVDVWCTTRTEDGRIGTTERVLSRALVDAAPGPDASGRSGVVLAVPRDAVPPLVSALRGGELDLVAVRS